MIFGTRPGMGMRGLCFTLVLAGLAASASAFAADVDAAVEGNTRFAFDLYNTVRQDGGGGGNVFFSPLSVSTALAMTYAGARGATEQQMARALHFGLPQPALHKTLSTLRSGLSGASAYELAIANRLWGQKDFRFSDEFLKLAETNYQGGLELLDFAADPEGSRKTINRWIEDGTRRKIRELLVSGDIKTLTRLVVTNAIYFKGSWSAKFDPNRTVEAQFTLQDGRTTVRVPMMSRTGRFSHMQDTMLQALELPYAGNRISMIVLLPNKGTGIVQVEKALTMTNLARWRSAMALEDVRVFLPKFKTTQRFLLNDALKKLGMPDAFDEDRADFSGMTGRRNLYISKVIHKAFVDVNEEGTEAAAATAVVVDTKSMRIEPVFRADRPFVFLILDKKSGSILFLGRIMNPVQQDGPGS